MLMRICLITTLNLCIVLSCQLPNANRAFNESSTENFTIAFGSCNHQWDEQPLWDIIAAKEPDLWIWTGDIIYADTEDMNKLSLDYKEQKGNPDYSKFIEGTSVIGIWDDHDYGVNNGGKEYPKRDSSKLSLFNFLEVPADNPAWKRQGAYQTYIYPQSNLIVKVILLDARYFRDARGKVDGTILGEDQWTWLERELSKNEADVHIVASGIQVIPEDHKYEKWSNIGHDRERLLKALTTVKNPILISGDRHLAEISRLIVNDKEIIEITSSGMTHAYTSFTQESNRHRIGEVFSDINFGLIEVQKSNNTINWKAEIADRHGAVQLHLNR